jgi:hypothetical protein
MKRHVSALLCLIATACYLVPALVPTADARWVQKEIRWTTSYQGGCATCTNIVVRDTAYTVLNGAGVLDTTAAFSLDDADIPPRGSVAPGITEVGGIGTAAFAINSDTTVAGYIVFTADSTAAPTATLSSLTVLIDGRVGGFGPSPAVALSRGWVKADSAVVNGAAGATLTVGDESVSIPIRTISPYGNVRRWSELRARTTTATGILGACRVFIRYWKNDAGSSQRY